MLKIPFLIRNLKYNKINSTEQITTPVTIIIDYLSINNNDFNVLRDKISLCIMNNSTFDNISSNTCKFMTDMEEENSLDYSKINIIRTTKLFCSICKRTFASLLSFKIHFMSFHSESFTYFLKDNLILISKYNSNHNENSSFYHTLLSFYSSHSFINVEQKLNKNIKIKKRKFVESKSIKAIEQPKKIINYKINKSLIKNFMPIDTLTVSDESKVIKAEQKKRLFRPKKDIKICSSKRLTSNQIRNLLRRHKNKTKKYNVLILNPVKKDYYHSISGEIISDTDSYVDSEYELDRKYEYHKEKQTIDDFTDICDQEKSFFKLWNEYIYNQNNSPLVSCMRAFDLVSNFILKYKDVIELQKLKENLGLHLITIFDNGMINKEQFNSLVQLIPN
jgi:hypothetical protein